MQRATMRRTAASQSPKKRSTFLRALSIRRRDERMHATATWRTSMKKSGPAILAAFLGATLAGGAYGGISGGGISTAGISGGGVHLLVVGPVEAISAVDKTAVVLGQRISAADVDGL